MKLTRSEMMRYSRVLATIPLQYTCPGEELIISHPEKGRHVRRQRQAWSRDDIQAVGATCLESLREEAESVLLTPCVHAVDDAVEPISEERTSRRDGKSHVRSGTLKTVSASPKAAFVGTYYASSITSARVYYQCRI